MVKKLKMQADQIHLKIDQRRARAKSEIELTDIWGKTGMGPRTNHQVLVGITLGAHRVEIANCAVEENVIPATDMKRWDTRHRVRRSHTCGILICEVFAALHSIGHRSIQFEACVRPEALKRNFSMSSLNQPVIFARHRSECLKLAHGIAPITPRQHIQT